MNEYKISDRVEFLCGFSHSGVFVPPGYIGTVQRDGVSLLGFVSIVAKRMQWLCKPDEIRPAPPPHGRIMEFERRQDGWPLCPHCGEDELWSPLIWDGEDERPSIDAYTAAGLSCYYCGWKNGANE